MAKSKEQKRKEALERLNARIAEREAMGGKPTFSQRMERGALSRPRNTKPNLSDIFGTGDPVTGMIYANPLPPDFRPSPELTRIVNILKMKNDRFLEMVVSLDSTPEFPWPTYSGSGTYMEQWVSRHTDYKFHHSKDLRGSCITVVFCRAECVPEYNENDYLLKGVSKEQYEAGIR
jgi:hypothetical protein